MTAIIKEEKEKEVLVFFKDRLLQRNKLLHDLVH